MDFDAVLIAPRRAASVAGGHWQDRTINDYLAACVRERPDATALTALSRPSDWLLQRRSPPPEAAVSRVPGDGFRKLRVKARPEG